MKISFNIEIKTTINDAVFADKINSIMLQPLQEKQKQNVTNKQTYRGAGGNESISTTFDVLVLLVIKFSK